jgi:acetoin utilization protein AcuB
MSLGQSGDLLAISNGFACGTHLAAGAYADLVITSEAAFQGKISGKETGMRIRDWMTTSPIVVSSETPVARAQELMRTRKIRHLPVMEATRLVGIVTDRDIRTVLASPATSLSAGELHYLLDQLSVAKVMTRTVITVGPHQPLAEAVRLMLEHKFGALPVTEHGRLVGILTETDLLRALAASLAAASGAPDPGGPTGDVSGRGAGAISKILVPLDGSPGSKAVLPTVADLALAERASVRLLRVVPPPPEVRTDDRVIAYADQETSRIELEILADLKRVGAGLGDVNVEVAVQFGEPVAEIVREAHAMGASLIAMATHRRSGIGRIVKGSVAELVERGTAIPVMLVQYGGEATG